MFYEFTKDFKVFESFGSVFPITSILTIDLAFSLYFFTWTVKMQKENNPLTFTSGL